MESSHGPRIKKKSKANELTVKSGGQMSSVEGKTISTQLIEGAWGSTGNRNGGAGVSRSQTDSNLSASNIFERPRNFYSEEEIGAATSTKVQKCKLGDL